MNIITKITSSVSAKKFVLVGAIAATLLFTQKSMAYLIVGHYGDNNPTTEGFFLSENFVGGALKGPVLDGGTNAWQLNTTDAPNTLQNASYRYNLTAPDLALMAEKGFSVKARFRIVADPNLSAVADPGIGIALLSGTRLYQLQLGVTSGGSLNVTRVGLGQTFTVAGGFNWHEVEFVDDNNDGNFDLYIDGVFQTSTFNWTGTAVVATPQAMFGDLTSGSGQNGTVNWALFEVNHFVPEPTTAVLLTASLAAIVLRRRFFGRTGN